MPEVSAPNITRLRKSPHTVRLGLAAFRPLIIASGTVSGTPGQGAFSISLSGYSETETPQQHFSVIAGSSAGDDDGGKTRLYSISGSDLQLAFNNIEWNTYTYVSILRVIEPWTVLPDLGNQTMDGRKSYVDENRLFHPLARIGPPGWIVGDDNVNFYSNSGAVADGASISSHSWSFPGGTPSTSSSAGTAGSPISVTWSTATGHVPQYVKYTVTDSNGKTHYRYNPQWVFTSFEDMILDFELETLSGDYDSGYWQMRFRVYEEATTTQFPQDCMIMLVCEDHYAYEKVSIGGNWTHREDVIFVGWITTGTVFRDDEDGSVSFEAVGTVGKMEALTSWPANLVYQDIPGNWNQIRGMTCDRAAFHVLTERSTLDHIADINLTANTKTLRYVDIPESDLRNQMNEYALLPIGARVLSDRQGQVYFSRNVNLRPTGERSAITVVMEMIFHDMRADPGLELGNEDMQKAVAQVDFIGFTYNGQDVTPLYSLAPRLQHEEGRVEKIDGVRADDQAEANVLSGLYLAERNNIWREIKCPSFNYRVFDIAPEEYTTLSLLSTDTRRGVVWSSQKLLCRSVDIAFERELETLRVNPVFEKDSFGPPGVGGGYPTEPPSSESNPTPTLRPPGDSIAAWNGFYFRKSKEASWVERGELRNVNFGCVDPWWFSRDKKNSVDPDRAIFYACGDAGFLGYSDNGGLTWTTITLGSDPPNTWSDSVAPTASTINFVWINGDNWQNGRFYALATWQGDGDAWRSWLLTTDDDFLTTSWTEMYNGTSLYTAIRARGLAVNSRRVLVTAWTDPDGMILQTYAPDTLVMAEQFDMGASTVSSEVGDDYDAYPVTVLDNDDLYFVAGRLNAPSGLSDPEHIVLSLDRGATWSSFGLAWTTDLVGSLIVGEIDDQGNRKYYAVRQG